jgi:hypothetical protein
MNAPSKHPFPVDLGLLSTSELKNSKLAAAYIA